MLTGGSYSLEDGTVCLCTVMRLPRIFAGMLSEKPAILRMARSDKTVRTTKISGLCTRSASLA